MISRLTAGVSGSSGPVGCQASPETISRMTTGIAIPVLLGLMRGYEGPA
jgi:hypothetical protein